jgi:hypothetical protein
MDSPERQVEVGPQFPFYKLPQDIQLDIFDQLNMRAPEQTVYWHIPDGFYVKELENKSLLFVNKDFYLKARELFWKQNHFIVCPDTRRAMDIVDPHEPVDPNLPPNRYAGAMFFDQFLYGKISTEVLQHLKSLEMEWFSWVDTFIPGQQPQKDWFNTLEACHRIAGLYLDFIFIPAGHVPMVPGDDFDTWNAMSVEDIIAEVRRLVQDEVWPLRGTSYMPPFTNHLIVTAGCDYVRIMYSHRKKGQETASRIGTEGMQRIWDREMRVPECPPLVSLQHMGQTTEDQARGDFRSKEWVEEIWMILVEDPYGEVEYMTEADQYF